MDISFSHKAIGHLLEAVTDSDVWMKVSPQVFESFVRPGGMVYALIRGPVNREVIKIDASGSLSENLKVARGQGGTSAFAWPLGALLFNSTNEDHYNSIIQRGQNRIIDYNPNEILAPLFAGEEIYQNGPAGCERWWKSYNGVDSYWDIITGAPCGEEVYTDVGGDYPVLVAPGPLWTLKGSAPQASAEGLLYDAGGERLILGTGPNAHIYTSDDGGQTWIFRIDIRAAQPFSRYATAFASDPHHGTIVVGAGYGNGVIYLSDDGGDTWTFIKDLDDNNPTGSPLSVIPCMAYDPVNHNIMAGTGNYGQAWLSTDGGYTWAYRKHLGFPNQIWSMCYDAYHGALIFCTNYAEIWTSENGGLSWTLRTQITGAESTPALCYDPINHRVLVGTFSHGKIWTSDDGGITWTFRQDLSIETQKTSRIYDIFYNPTNHKLYLTGVDYYDTYTSRIWVSVDGGITWTFEEDVSQGSDATMFAYDIKNGRSVFNASYDFTWAQIWAKDD
jgi:photosystem II stability/assembly factor-like uncharacterized protein